MTWNESFNRALVVEVAEPLNKSVAWHWVGMDKFKYYMNMLIVVSRPHSNILTYWFIEFALLVIRIRHCTRVPDSSD